MRYSRILRYHKLPSMIQIVLLALIGLLVFNEFLSHVCFSIMLWANLQNKGPPEENVRMLFVADPQLIGMKEHPSYGALSRWDADRYLSKTFWFSYNKIKPDIVIFMGDLFDEGSTASDGDYKYYHQRFKQVFYTAPTTERIYLAGDNDVGGEDADIKLPWKVQRFREFFSEESGVTTVKFVDFIKINSELGSQLNDKAEQALKELRSKSSASHRILLNHMALLVRHKLDFVPIVHTLEPSIVFTAHTHKARIYTCYNCQFKDANQVQYKSTANSMEGYAVHTFLLNNLDVLQEISVPTCSYRMGVSKMGYGAAVISKDGTFQYTILWVPSRYFQLYCYLCFPIIVVVGIILRVVIGACYTYRQVIFGIS